MRFYNEIRKPDELDLPKKSIVCKKELELAVQLIEQLTEPWEPEELHGTAPQ